MSDAEELMQTLAEHPRLDVLAGLVRTAALSAADETRSRFSDGIDELAREVELTPEDAVIGEHDLLAALRENELGDHKVRMLLSQLTSRGVALKLEEDDIDLDRLAGQLSWLAAHTAIDALWSLDDQASREIAGPLWSALGNRVVTLDASGCERGEALAALAGLRRSQHPTAHAAITAMEGTLTDPALIHSTREPETTPAVGRVITAEEVTLQGERTPVPLGPFALVLQAVTGILFLRGAWRFIAKWIFRIDRPTELRVTGEAITAKTQLRLLGRTLRTSETQIKLSNLAIARCEVRFPRLGLYAGLIALALGSYFGIKLMTEAALVGSPSLIAIGALVVGAGLLLDFLLSSFLPSRGETRILVLVPRRGASFAASIGDARSVRAALDLLD